VNDLPKPIPPANGKWVVLTLIALGIIGGSAGLFIRARAPSLAPTTAPSTTRPTTAP
jgi:hypothetical protein